MTDGSQPRRGKGMKKTATTMVRYESLTTIDRPIGEVFADQRTWMVTEHGCTARACSGGPAKPLRSLLAQEPPTPMPRGWAPSAVK